MFYEHLCCFHEPASASRNAVCNPLPGTDKAWGGWAGGIEFRTTKGLWVSTGLGHRLPSAGTRSEPALLFAGLRWQLASTPQFGPAK